MLDDIDYRILDMLQRNARVSNAEIARAVGMAASAIFERIRKLEERGVIQGYHARLDPHAVGYGLVAFVSIKTAAMGKSAEILEHLSSIPEVQEVHLIVGDDCFQVKVRVADTRALARLLQDRIQSLEFVGSTRTTIVLETAKERLELPLAVEAREEREPAPAVDRGAGDRDESESAGVPRERRRASA